jgi:hypothetical protein
MTAATYQTFWGNSIQGFYITWGNAADAAVPISGTTEMTFDIDMRLYALADSLDTATVADASSLNFYFLIQNPIDKVAYDTAIAISATDILHYNSWVTFDGLYGTLNIAVASTPNTISLDSPVLVDINCANAITEGAYDSSNCVEDTTVTGTTNGGTGTNDYTETTGLTDYCVETWDIGGAEQRCMRISVKGKRYF